MTRDEILREMAELDAIEAEQGKRKEATGRLQENPGKAEHEGEARASAPPAEDATAAQGPVRPDAPPIGYGVPASAFQGKFSGADPQARKAQPSQLQGSPGTRYPQSMLGAGTLPPNERSQIPAMLGGLLGEGLGGPLGGGIGMMAGGAIGRSMRDEPVANPQAAAIDFGLGAGPGTVMKGVGMAGGAMAKSAKPGMASLGNRLQAFVKGLSPADNAMNRHPMQNVSGDGGLAQVGAAGPGGANVAVRDAANSAGADATAANNSSMGGNIPPYVSGEYSRGAQELGSMAPPLRTGGDPHVYAHVGPAGVRLPVPGMQPGNGFVNNNSSTARWLAAVAEASRRGKQLQLVPELQQLAQESMTSLGPSSRSLSAPVAGLLGSEAP